MKVEYRLHILKKIDEMGLWNNWHDDMWFLFDAISRESDCNENPKPNRNVHKDGSISYDHGLCQINDKSWDNRAEELGLSYKDNPLDNLSMCIVVLREHGRSAWISMNKIKKDDNKSKK